MALTLRPEAYGGITVEPIIQRILDGNALCAMATVNADGTAHVNTAFFCVDGEWRMFFMSSNEAKHTRNIATRASVAVAVCESGQDWDDWKTGLQLFGTCAAARGRDAGLGIRLYEERFPAFARWLQAVGGAVGHGDVPSLFVFVPESLKLLHEEVLGEETFVTIALSRD